MFWKYYYVIIFEWRASVNDDITADCNSISDQCECDIRDTSKKISRWNYLITISIYNMLKNIRFESEFEVTAEQLLANQNRLADLDKKLNEEDGKVSSLNRRLMLLEVTRLLRH